MTRFRPALALGLAPLALLAACSGGDDAAAPANDTNYIDEGPVVENALDTPFVNAEPTPEPTTNTALIEEPAPKVSDSEQIQADAEATGMTARVDRSAEPDVEEPALPAEK